MNMANPEQPTRTRRRAAAVACVTLVLLVACAARVAGSQPRRAQQQPSPVKPNIAVEVEEKKGNGENDNKATPARKQGRAKQPQPKPTPAYELNIKTDIPEAEIFYGAGGSAATQSLGKTDAEGNLTARLPRGTYNLLASRPGFLIQRQRIEVRSGAANSVNFRLALPAVARKEEPAPTPEPTPTPEAAETPADPLADADALIKRYLDAKETESVKADDWKPVRDAVYAALEKDPDNAQLKARALAADGQLAYLAGDFPNALVAFKQAALAAPELAVAHYGLGNAYLATNQPSEAFKAYQRAVAINGELALAFRGMGDALAKQNKTREAAQFYDRAKTLGGQPLPADTGLAAARALKKRKRWAQALKEFQDVAEAQPTAEVYVEIGDCYVGLEQPLSASQSYRKATELDPKSALAHYKFGEVMHKLREYQAAMEAFERALALDLQGTSINRRRARELADEAAERLKKMN
jgi:tetratricopeptide (TPR) repeat protein